MDAYRRATPDGRARGRHKVATVTAWTGVVATAVTGWLAVGLSPHATVAAGTTSGTTSGTSGTTDDGPTSSGSGVSGSGSAPVTTSGGS